jgi:hypothetical protein
MLVTTLPRDRAWRHRRRWRRVLGAAALVSILILALIVVLAAGR